MKAHLLARRGEVNVAEASEGHNKTLNCAINLENHFAIGDEAVFNMVGEKGKEEDVAKNNALMYRHIADDSTVVSKASLKLLEDHVENVDVGEAEAEVDT